MDDREFATLITSIENNSCDFRLNLKKSKIDHQRIQKLGDALAKNTTVKSLDLSDNWIDDQGIKLFVEGLAKNTTLRILNLQRNGIDQSGAKLLAMMLIKNTTLQSLNLGSNPVRNTGAKAIFEALGKNKNTALQSLNFEGCNTIDKDAVKTIAAALTQNTTLQYLNLEGTELGVACMQSLAGVLDKNTTIHTIKFHHNSFNLIKQGSDTDRIYKNFKTNLGKRSEAWHRKEMAEVMEKTKLLASITNDALFLMGEKLYKDQLSELFDAGNKHLEGLQLDSSAPYFDDTSSLDSIETLRNKWKLVFKQAQTNLEHFTPTATPSINLPIVSQSIVTKNPPAVIFSMESSVEKPNSNFSPEKKEIKEHIELLQPMTLEGHTNSVSCVSISPNRKLALSGSNDKTLKIWDLKTGKCEHLLEGHTHCVYSAALSMDGAVALSGSVDKTVRVWNPKTGKCEQVLLGHTGTVSSVAISADEAFALSGGRDKSLRIWNLKTGKCDRVIEAHLEAVTCVALIPDTNLALSGSDDKTLKIWDLKTGKCKQVFEGHTDGVTCVVISEDKKFALSGSLDRTLRFWDLKTGKCEQVFPDHTDIITSVGLGAGRTIALSGSAKELRIWDIKNSKCIRVAHCQTAVMSISTFTHQNQVYALIGLDDGGIEFQQISSLPEANPEPLKRSLV